MMRSRVALLLLAAVVLASPVAQAQVPVDGFKSNNVEWLGNIREAAIAATVHGNYLYGTNERWLWIYDISDPEEPVEAGRVELLAIPYHQQASPSTNGEILLLNPSFLEDNLVNSSPPTDDPSVLFVIDVRDKSDPRVLSTFRYKRDADYAWTCILDCRWAYGGYTGSILDLRDPRRPRLSTRTWLQATDSLDPPGNVELPNTYAPRSYGVREVRRGIVLSATTPMYLLDARRDPEHPRLVQASDGSPYSYGGVDWPVQGRSRFILSFNLFGAFYPRCEMHGPMAGSSFDGAFATWDTSPWDRDELIRPTDTYYPRNGTFVDGDPPVSSTGLYGGCMAGNFDPNPDYRRTGIIALTSTGHGVKFLEITSAGEIVEVGYFLPYGGNVWDAEWGSDEIFYSIDFHRGVDILRFRHDD